MASEDQDLSAPASTAAPEASTATAFGPRSSGLRRSHSIEADSTNEVTPATAGGKKRSRGHALESGGTTPTSEEFKSIGGSGHGNRLTPLAKRGRTQNAEDVPGEASSSVSIDPGMDEAEEAPTSAPGSPTLPPSHEVRETAQAVNTLRGKVRDLSTGDRERLDSETASQADDSAPRTPTKPTAGGPPADPNVPDIPAAEAAVSITAAPIVSAAPTSPSARTLKAASSSPPPSAKSVGGFASFSSAASPFASVPTGSGSSRGAFGGRANPQPLSRPNLAALQNSTGAPPSPSASIRAEAGSVVPSRPSSPRPDREEANSTPVPPEPTASEATTSTAVEPPPTPAAAAPAQLSEAVSPGSVSRQLEKEVVAESSSKPSPFAAFKSGFGSASGSVASPSKGGFGAYSGSGSAFARSSAVAEDGAAKGKRSFGALLRGEGEDGSTTSVTDAKEDSAEPERKVFKEQQVVTGEEDDEVIQSVRAKLYVLEDSNWKERGTGMIRLLAAGDKEVTRLVMRNDATHRLILNVPLFGAMVCAVYQDKFVRFTSIENAKDLVSYMIRVGSNASALSFQRRVSEAISRIAASSAPETV